MRLPIRARLTVWYIAVLRAIIGVLGPFVVLQFRADMRAAIKFEMQHPHFNFRRELRHSTEVDYHRFREELRRELKKAGVEIGAPPKGFPSRYKKTPATAVRSSRAA